MIKTKSIFDKIGFYSCLPILIYFSLLLFISDKPIEAIDVVRFFGESLSLPFLVILIFNFLYSLYKLIKEKSKMYFLIFSISLINIMMLSIATYLDLSI